MASSLMVLLFQSDVSPGQVAAAGGLLAGMALVLGVFAFIMVASLWKVFAKAGEPGWAAIVPIYNIIVLLKIAGKPAWWFVLMIIPIVNFIAIIALSLSVARKFGKGTGFALGLTFLSPVFYPILGFGSARYSREA
jgi:hypothetical protein